MKNNKSTLKKKWYKNEKLLESYFFNIFSFYISKKMMIRLNIYVWKEGDWNY
jgi:hypothetical protein